MKRSIWENLIPFNYIPRAPPQHKTTPTPHVPIYPPPPPAPRTYHSPPPPAPTHTPEMKKILTLFMLYLSTIFVYSSVFFRYSEFFQVKVEISLHDDSSRFRYSTGYVFISSSWFLLRPYDVAATFCSFVHAISTELHVWRHFSLLVERVFCSCAWLNFWSHLTHLTLKNDLINFKLTFIHFNSKR